MLQMPIPQVIAVRELVSSQQLQEAWGWLLDHIQVRPAAPGQLCYFDNKCWNDNPINPNFAADFNQICRSLGLLYIASQFGDHRQIICMVHGQPAPAINWLAGNLDRDIRAVIQSAPRFRNHLSEHLSFWVRLALEKIQRGLAYQSETPQFTHSKPNIQPEDKGPDGLYLEIEPSKRIEIQSIKNSINNPQKSISSAQFRKKGTATQKKLLDDFWLLHHQNDGLLRLDELVDRALISLQTDWIQKLRLGLIKTSSYNAVVVANTQYADEALFQGYQFVTPEITRRIATYIGAVNWRTLATETHRIVRQILHHVGIV